MELVFYVNGIQAVVSAEPSTLLNEVAQIALNQIGQADFLVKDFICICDNNILDFNSKVNCQFVWGKYGGKTGISVVLENRQYFLLITIGHVC